uniref:Uncharacterized protein n=1 Tax=Arundo donax TaxID=35708 RepID=A0A0A9H9R5_ARUDO
MHVSSMDYPLALRGLYVRPKKKLSYGAQQGRKDSLA